MILLLFTLLFWVWAFFLKKPPRMGSESLHVKVSVGDELRRFAVERNVTYEELMVRLGTLSGPLVEGSVVSYVDDKGDMVNVTSTLELQ
eukprot:CAMPEP_0184744764 /NCGR_PEP_ID=MMETSP0315-20130426/7469_1 /TAXON_ID=101924 /ORGANISM="Rhodosorus marinus, Strain UTEX LB 2760" /LENGTH=88 /DNA_ID=CAMNT_0027216587 /DNA_START=1 /DNA_END=264 /DNA_ORIENTATION=+